MEPELKKIIITIIDVIKVNILHKTLMIATSADYAMDLIFGDIIKSGFVGVFKN